MKKELLSALFVLSLALPGETTAQVDLSRATYISVEQWRDTINALPGVDRQIISQDIGKLNLSVGIIHRNALDPSARRGGGGENVGLYACAGRVGGHGRPGVARRVFNQLRHSVLGGDRKHRGGSPVLEGARGIQEFQLCVQLVQILAGANSR